MRAQQDWAGGGAGGGGPGRGGAGRGGVGQDFISVENYVVALLLRRDEKPGKYREILKTIAAEILEKIPDDAYKEVLPGLYAQLANV